ncbi:MAG: lytic transglycosylase domain-containing protein [Mycobacteriaceae bacterium]
MRRALVLLPLLAVGLAGYAMLQPGPATPRPQAPPGPGASLPALVLDGPGRGADQLAGWATTESEPTGIPAQALQAYGWAAAVAARTHPGCGITWTTLAGIGKVESNHGRYAGSHLDAANRAEPPIRGLTLDGGPGLAEIVDTDGGRLDGNRTYDRAVGPMQFIPGTWARWGIDADGDGRTDPDDLDDAALAAADYLCVSGGDLRTGAGWRQAILTYNRSAVYVADVLAQAAGYADESS